jgi:hypothetical protein
MGKKHSRRLSFFQHIKQLFRRKGGSARAARSCRPRVETLEVRVMPAVDHWTGGADTSDWTKAGNWDNGVPTSTSDVVIGTPGGPAVSVTYSAGTTTTVNTLSVGPQSTLQITGNSTIVTAASTGTQVLDNGEIDLGDSTYSRSAPPCAS